MTTRRRKVGVVYCGQWKQKEPGGDRRMVYGGQLVEGGGDGKIINRKTWVGLMAKDNKGQGGAEESGRVKDTTEREGIKVNFRNTYSPSVS